MRLEGSSPRLWYEALEQLVLVYTNTTPPGDLNQR
jgi:hypothetical protein